MVMEFVTYKLNWHGKACLHDDALQVPSIDHASALLDMQKHLHSRTSAQHSAFSIYSFLLPLDLSACPLEGFGSTSGHRGFESNSRPGDLISCAASLPLRSIKV